MIRVLILMLALAGCFASQAGEPALKVFLLDNGVTCVRAVSVTDTLTGQLQTELTNQISGLVLDLRFASGAKNLTVANFLPARKTPIIVLVNAQTRGAAGQLAAQLQAAGTGIVIGGTNGTISPDVTLSVSPAQEKAFQDNPYFTAATQQTGTVSGTNALLSLVDHMSEAELVSKRIKDGEGEYNPAPASRAEPAANVIRDPALARAVDLLKAVAALHPARG